MPFFDFYSNINIFETKNCSQNTITKLLTFKKKNEELVDILDWYKQLIA